MCMEDGPSAKMSKLQLAVADFITKLSSLPLRQAGVFLVLLILPWNLLIATESIRIITTNDIHTYLKPLYYRYLDEIKPWGEQSREGNYVQKASIEGKVGGMAHVATVIKNLKEDEKTKLMCLSGVKQYPMRVKCATLSWHTLVSAIDEKKEEVKTEN